MNKESDGMTINDNWHLKQEDSIISEYSHQSSGWKRAIKVKVLRFYFHFFFFFATKHHREARDEILNENKMQFV